jgi:hypothetical protein
MSHKKHNGILLACIIFPTMALASHAVWLKVGSGSPILQTALFLVAMFVGVILHPSSREFPRD